MYYLIISIAATVVGAIVFYLEQRGDPSELERHYAKDPDSKTPVAKSRPR